jgi:signal transduction histidine kinase
VADAVAYERARTRAWLHDTVLQELEMLAAGAYADEPDPAAMAVLAAGAADRLRSAIEGEPPPAAGLLVQEITELVQRQRRLGRQEIRLQIGRLERPWDNVRSAPLTAAVAEAVRNAVKHSDASLVTVSCEISGGVVTVTVADNGCGFDPALAGQGAGLRHSVVGRLAHEGGSVTIDSAPGRGARLVLRLGLGLRLSRAQGG